MALITATDECNTIDVVIPAFELVLAALPVEDVITFAPINNVAGIAAVSRGITQALANIFAIELDHAFLRLLESK